MLISERLDWCVCIGTDTKTIGKVLATGCRNVMPSHVPSVIKKK